MGLLLRKRREDVLRLFIASDLHGSTVCFKKFLQAADRYEADALLLAGDLTGKMVVPIVADGCDFVSNLHGMERCLGPHELEAHEELIDSIGLYSYRTTPDEMKELESRPDQVDAIFHQLVAERIERWLELGQTRLTEADRYCYFVAGNDDYRELDALLRQGDRMRFVDGRRAEIDEQHEIIGLGLSNPTPWHAPRDVAEDDIAQLLGSLGEEVENPGRAVFMVHVPPKDTLLDVAPELDNELRPTAAGTNLINVGSTAVREALERFQPLLSVHGHIHESRGIDHIGRTTCVNAGSEYGQAILRGALVIVSHDRVHGHLFVSG